MTSSGVGDAVAEQAGEDGPERARLGQDRAEVEERRPCWRSDPASPNSWMAKATSPADTKISTTPVIVKNRREVDPDARRRRWRSRSRPRPPGPASAPTRVWRGRAARGTDREQEEDRLEPLAERRRRTRDRPAPVVDPAARAMSTPRSRSPFIARPWRRIQNSIQVRTMTARTRGEPFDALLDRERQPADRRPRRGSRRRSRGRAPRRRRSRRRATHRAGRS